MSETVNEMDPDASPGTVRSGVRRVNNMPMYILGAVVLSFLLMMALVAADRSAKQNAPPEIPKEQAGNTAMFAKEIAGEKTGGLVEPAQPLTVPDMPSASASASAPLEIARPANPDMPPPPPPLPGNAGAPGQPMNDDEAQRIRMAKMQMFDEAVKAKTTVRMEAPRSRGSAPVGTPAVTTRDEVANRLASVQQQLEAQRGTDPTAAYKARLEQIRSQGLDQPNGGGGGGSGASRLTSTGSPGQGRSSHSQFGAGGQGDRWKLDSQPQAPNSPYELRTGFVIPATLLSGINSELPGQIMAQVSQDVFDTATGNHKLVPQGSRLIGQYSSEVAYGQSRVLIAWQRIVFPDGKALDIGAMPGADSAGYSGFNDKVDNHYIRIFSSALLMSAITAGVSMTQNCDSESSGSGSGSSTKCALSEALGQQLGMTTTALIAKNLNIAPTLQIRPGYRFNVIVTKDLTFTKPFRPFDY